MGLLEGLLNLTCNISWVAEVKEKLKGSNCQAEMQQSLVQTADMQFVFRILATEAFCYDVKYSIRRY